MGDVRGTGIVRGINLECGTFDVYDVDLDSEAFGKKSTTTVQLVSDLLEDEKVVFKCKEIFVEVEILHTLSEDGRIAVSYRLDDSSAKVVLINLMDRFIEPDKNKDLAEKRDLFQ